MRTSEVMVGGVGIGGDNPIRIQSMTNTPTLDTIATVNQIMHIAEAGAEIVRLTVQSMKEAENLGNIRNELQARGCIVPLVADVHFNPAVAETAAAIVDKVRINPGNYGIKQKSGSGILTEEEYKEDLHRAKEKFVLLLKICRKNNTALRIGVNHGSLSSRILNRYGNTPAGMVESAMEFIRFCIEENFHRVVVSLKSSNTVVMTQANIAMVNRMVTENMSYPLHLGVTEAGEGDDGRIRSAVGIGTLLALGIGSTIRVSLTEDPEREIPVARQLVSHIEEMSRENLWMPDYWNNMIADSTSPQVNKVANIGGEQVPVVVSDYQESEQKDSGHRKPVQSGLSEMNRFPGSFKRADNIIHKGEGNQERGGSENEFLVPDYIFTKNDKSGAMHAAVSEIITTHDIWQTHYKGTSGFFPLFTASQYKFKEAEEYKSGFLQISLDELTEDILSQISHDPGLVLIAFAKTGNPSGEFGQFIEKVRQAGCKNPVILKKKYETADEGYFRIQASVDFGSVLLNNESQGIWIQNHLFNADLITSLSFSILQSCRRRITKTEFISCPSCGRTMFDIQKATSLIKGKVSHLRGLKIAIMGCIVNGPGEMADADYGYVGAGRGRVSLYKKKVVVKRNIPEEQAIDELITLIRESGDWVES